METNYRCAKKIVEVADTVISNNENRLPKKMHSGRDDILGVVEINDYSNLENEYSSIANKIALLKEEGRSYDSIAILIRNRKNLNLICEALNSKAIPYKADSTDSFFEGVNYKAYLSIISFLSSNDRELLYNSWKYLLSDEQFMNGFRQLKRFARTGGDAKQKPLSKAIDDFVTYTDYVSADNDERHRERDRNCFNQILNDIDEIYEDQQFSARVSKAIKFIERDAQNEYQKFAIHEEVYEGVQIMTIHKSKGLEFDCVFVPDLENGVFPSRKVGGRKYWHVLGEPFEEMKEKYESTEEDERKLFYVAVTRAKEKLYCSFETSKKDISTFIIEACSSEYVNFDISNVLSKSKKNAKKSKQNRKAPEEYEERLDKKALKNEIMNYYGTARHFNKLAGADLTRVSGMWDEDELVGEAKKVGIDVNKFYS